MVISEQESMGRLCKVSAEKETLSMIPDLRFIAVDIANCRKFGHVTQKGAELKHFFRGST
jgi:hypothetical protein